MEVRYSPIYREGNVPADILSNLALSYPSLTWWSGPTLKIKDATVVDYLDRPKYRFC